MGVFDDKKFDELDWISQATEPIDSNLNIILSNIPDEINVDYKLYIELISNRWSVDITLEQVINHFILKNGCFSLQHESRQAIQKCFEMVVEGDLILNCHDEQITGGTIKLIKNKTTIDEKNLEGLLGLEAKQHIAIMFIPRDGGSRANDIMELLGGCEDGLRSRSDRRKKSVIHKRVGEIFKDNLWNIRDTELATKVGSWIRCYIENGNLAAYSNFCRLKVMTHKGQPIYSMEEVK